ncbi:unnamed protein product, partial [Didymodactylos carnosus]
ANDMIHAPYEPINKRKTSEDDTLLDLHSQVMQNCTSTSRLKKARTSPSTPKQSEFRVISYQS